MLDKDWNMVFKNLRRGVWTPFIAYFYRFYFSLKNKGGVRVMEEDWDYLIVLDACRYDAFEEVNWLEGELEKKRSLGSATFEWRDENFTDYYGDVVYVTANPYISDREDFRASEHFHSVIPVYMEDDYQEKGITKPEAVTEEAIEAEENFPDKRKIIHYMQPHDPFIGEPSISMFEGDVDETHEHFAQENSWEAYKANLERALESVEELIEQLEGKIVITGDHGDCFGEKFLKRHPRGVYIKELVEVPWLVIEKGERKKVEEGEIEGVDI
ncbi:MAG: hypothetical protein ABEJ56_07125 [Candidatus Nanohaloarchaea archaeon]